MSEANSRKWLASPIKHVSDYEDWPQMNPITASAYDGWRAEPHPDEFMSVYEFLDGIADYSRYFCREYDDDASAYFIADPLHRSKMLDIAVTVAALRGASDFVDGPSFIYVFPAVSGGDPEALLEISPGKSEFRNPNDTSPEMLYFVNEAEEFIETLMEDDDED
jgi:hypothetical protein